MKTPRWTRSAGSARTSAASVIDRGAAAVDDRAVMRILPADARAAFAADGVICLRGLVDADAVELLRAATEAALAGPAALFSASGRPLPDSFLWLTQPAVAELLLRAPIAAVAGALLGTAAPRLFYDQIFAKDPGRSLATPWHQDAPYWPISGEALTVWIALDPVDHEGGAVRYLPGSHRDGVLYRPTSHQDRGAWEAVDLPPLPDLDALPPEALREWTLAPGDALVHHARTIHGAGPNTRAGRPRRAYATRWLGDDARWTPGPETMDFPLPVEVRPGDPLRGTLFPEISIAAEI